MDIPTRNAFALLNAHQVLLEALYLEVLGTNPDSIERMRSYIFKRIEDPYILPIHDPKATEEALEIRPRTAEIVEGFLQSLYPQSRSDSTELSKPDEIDDEPIEF